MSVVDIWMFVCFCFLMSEKLIAWLWPTKRVWAFANGNKMRNRILINFVFSLLEENETLSTG